MQRRKIVAAVAVLVACAAAVWFSARQRPPLPLVFGTPVSGTTTAGVPAAASAPTSRPVEALAGNVSRYMNDFFDFSLEFPSELQVQEYAAKTGARTVVFETVDHKTGIQIYIIPYTGATVSREQFLKDQPSGVYDQPLEIWVASNTPAIMFYGYNDVMGDTREVWFIHDGFLYEVTTYKELEQQLAKIMATWKFL